MPLLAPGHFGREDHVTAEGVLFRLTAEQEMTFMEQKKKVLLILADGMRPDALRGIPFVETLKKTGTHSMHARTVYPSNTLACHMSLFHSIPPAKHGMDNFYRPMPHPVHGICEQTAAHGLQNAFFYSWEALRNLTRPELDTLLYASFISGRRFGYDVTTRELTDQAIDLMQRKTPDFVFLYLGWPDCAGHTNGWMSEPYLHAVRGVWEQIERVMAVAGDAYNNIITADHGGHDYGHGSDLPEDMTIPLFLCGEPFVPGYVIEDASILDIAPTVTDLLGIPAIPEWEGKSLVP